jgi:O-acetyl-ADP-ribose deacetylase (regulator of RNase III)
MTQVSVALGDISREKVDCLITAINSSGLWFGAIDRVLQDIAGDAFHSHLRKAMPLKDGQTVVVDHNGFRRGGAFANVVFVVDDLQRPLHEIIREGLLAASVAGYKSVAIPTIRMGVMIGVVEKSTEEAIDELAKGVKGFLVESPSTPIKTIRFVVHSDQNLQTQLQKALM